jgi:L-amino acid N-acyltransferase YncA
MIRTATTDDAAAVAAIYAPIVRDTTISFELQPPTVDEMRTRIEATLSRLPWLVNLDDDGAVNGYVYAGKHRDPGAYRWSVNTSVYVRDDSRGQGVGKRLYLALLDELRRLGYFQAFAGIALPNTGSVALHESLGFEPIGVYRNVGHKHGAWRDVGWWQRPVQALAAPTAEPLEFVSC